MTPEQLAKPGTEHAHQVAFFCWAASKLEAYPCLKWMYAVPNGGDRNPIVAARLKAEGVKSGVSDICLPFGRQGYSGAYIEMKKPGGKESANQKEFGAFLATENYLYRCCLSWEEAANTVAWYLTIE